MFEVNAMGKQCPIPLIMTKEAVEKNGNGTYLVKVDNQIAVQNLEKMSKKLGFGFSYKKTTNQEFEVSLNVENAQNAKNTNNQSIIENAEIPVGVSGCGPVDLIDSSNTVVVIKSQYMGIGDNDLGTVLMKGFIYSLSQLNNPPKTVIMYNSGVKYACTGSKNLEDLQALKDKGVQIFACGTCLNHFNFQDNLEIGEVTNMYDIVEMLNDAKKIIYP